LEVFDFTTSCKILDKTIVDFKNSNSVAIKIGCELEFFLFSSSNQPIENNQEIKNFISLLRSKLINDFSLIYDIEKEQGISQIEVKFGYTDDVLLLVKQIEKAKIVINNLANQFEMFANFTARPLIGDCSNALQFNISLHQNNLNLFSNHHNIYLQNTIAGILFYLKEMTALAVEDKKDFARFDCNYNLNLYKAGKYVAPTTISFGYNNRTTALRIEKNRLEYRLPTPNCNYYLVLAAFIFAINDGIKKNLNPQSLGFQPIYGNSFDEKYQLEEIIDYNSAIKLFNYSVIRDYFATISTTYSIKKEG